MIINYLIKALCEKESVYVNKLGLFRKQYEPAQIGDGMITPPGYKVVFDPDFDGNGFAFTMFVSQKGGMLITDATTQIDQWVSQLNTALDNNKSVSFENFGTFAKNENGSITYTCDRISELNTDFEGMEPVPLLPKTADIDSEHENLIKEEQENTTDKLVADNDATDIQEETQNENQEKNIQEIDQEDKSDTKNEKAEDENKPIANDKKKRHTWLIVLIILLLLAIIAAAAYYFKEQLKELYQQHFGQQTEIVTEEPTPIDTIASTTIVDSLNYTDSLAMSLDSSANAAISEDVEESINTIEIKPQEKQTISQLPGGENFFINYEKGKHYVIVGSFRTEKEVRQHIKGRKLEQYNPKVVMQPGSKQMRICIGVFDTEAAADNYGRGTGLNYWVLK